jgi:bis(5'-nucleosidyl)-tetraphosphatase
MGIKYDYSFGIIPLTKKNNVWNVLLVQLHAGHWGFPKGHADPEESHFETAQRELLEETGLNVCHLLTEQTFEENYTFRVKGSLIHKKVIYFIAEVEGVSKILEEEIKAIQWVPLNESSKYVTFDQAKKICLQVDQLKL